MISYALSQEVTVAYNTKKVVDILEFTDLASLRNFAKTILQKDPSAKLSVKSVEVLDVPLFEENPEGLEYINTPINELMHQPRIRPTVYNRAVIADELEATAKGKAYYGNAFYVARDLPELDDDDREVLSQWLNDNRILPPIGDHQLLHNIIHKIRSQGDK